MPLAEQITDESRFFGLFIGRSGHGKTTASLSFPHPIKVYDIDGRIRGGVASKWIDRKGIEYEPYPIYSDKGTVFQRLNKDFETLLTQCKINQCPYKTLVLSSITKQAIAFLLDAIPLTHVGGKGRTLGTLQMGGPQDYGFMSTGTWQVMAFLKSLPIQNIIVEAHIVPKWGKPPGYDPSKDQMAENIIVGEELALTDKLAASIPGDFDHIFRFEKQDVGNSERFYFSAHSDLARTAYDIPYGQIDITGQSFYEKLRTYMKKVPNEIKTQ